MLGCRCADAGACVGSPAEQQPNSDPPMAKRVDLLDFLLSGPKVFAGMPRAQQLELARNRPTPSLDIKEWVGGVKSSFTSQWYTTYYWLTGSLSQQKLYCFICLLYGDVSVISREEGECGNFHDKAMDHQNSGQHIRNCERHAELIHSTVDTRALEVKKDSPLVRNRRKTLKRILQLFYFSIKITYKPLDCNATSVLDDLVSHLSSNDVFLPMGIPLNFSELSSETFQQSMLQAIKRIGTRTLKERELKTADYVSAAINVVEKKPNRYSLLVRYVSNNKICERFLTFFETPHQLSEGIFEAAYGQLVEWGIENKLVCISYDNPRLHITSENINVCFNNEEYIKPLILYNCNYNLCSIIWQACARVDYVAAFANRLSVLYSFMNNKSYFADFFGDDVQVPNYLLNFDSRKSFACPKLFMCFLATDFHKLKNALSFAVQNAECYAEQNSKAWDPTASVLAKEILSYFKSNIFAFLIAAFNKVFLRVDHLSCFTRLFSYKDIPRLVRELQQTITSFNSMDNTETFSKLWETATYMVGRQDRVKKSVNLEELKSCYSKIIKTTIKNIRIRFADFESLQILELLNFKNLSEAGKENHLKIIENYLDNFHIFNFTKLRNELSIIYDDKSKHMEPEALYFYLQKKGLSHVFDQTMKLIRFIQCLPLTTILFASNKTKYDRVNRFVELEESHKSLSELDIIALEKELFEEFFKDELFLEDVVDNLIKQNVDQQLNLYFPIKLEKES